MMIAIVLAVLGWSLFAASLWLSKKRLEDAEKRILEQKQTFEAARNEVEKSFQALASEALAKNTNSFLQLASERLDKKTVEASSAFEQKVQKFQLLVDPIQQTLKKMEQDISSVEKERKEQFGRISEQLTQVTTSSENLRKEASLLSNALRRPEVRGSWGEIQLKRVVELAGMSAYCDFEEQVSTNTTDGKLRPDMIVRLPNERVIVVDAKAVLDAFLDAVEAATPEKKKDALDRHARNIRSRVKDLAKKSYWEQFEHAPEFAVLFIPNEAILAAAVEVDRNILEDALSDKIIITTPTNLVALLKAVAYGWQQEQITQNAQKILNTAKEFYERLTPWLKHFSDIGKNLESSVKSYNNAMGSLESRVLPSARKMKELGISTSEEIKEMGALETTPRELKEQL